MLAPLFSPLFSPRGFAALIVAVTVIALGTAFTAQFAYGLDPCILCVYQRVPYLLLAIVGVYGLGQAGKGPTHGIALLAALLFAVGAGIAFFHVGVEQGWWPSGLPCAGGLDPAQSSQDFLASLQKKPTKSCSDIDWALFGVSMATYNAGVSAVMAVFCLIAWPRVKRSERTR